MKREGLEKQPVLDLEIVFGQTILQRFYSYIILFSYLITHHRHGWIIERTYQAQAQRPPRPENCDTSVGLSIGKPVKFLQNYYKRPQKEKKRCKTAGKTKHHGHQMAKNTEIDPKTAKIYKTTKRQPQKDVKQ